MLQAETKTIDEGQLQGFISKLEQGKSSPRLKQAKPWLRIALTLSIAAYLIYKLSAIGWGQILQSLPTAPGFYLLAIAFVSLPILTERFVFPMAAKASAVPRLKIFIRRHTLNKAVMNYAGEGYFLNHIAKPPTVSLIEAAVIVKNLALARTFAANFWILLLVLSAITFGRSDVLSKIITISPDLAIAVSLLSLGFCLGSVVFFKKLTRLDFSVAVKIASLYLLRSFLAACILVSQWAIALPGTALSVWFLFLIIFFIAKKSPVGGDLVFVSIALTLPGLTGDSAAIAAMLVANAVVLQIIYSIGFVSTSDLRIQKKSGQSIGELLGIRSEAH